VADPQVTGTVDQGTTTGTTAMTNRNRLDNNFLSVDMDGVLSFRPDLGLCTKHGAQPYSKRMNDVKKVLET